MHPIIYRIREKLVYSFAGKLVATLIRNRHFPHCRVHWVQSAMIECTWERLEEAEAMAKRYEEKRKS